LLVTDRLAGLSERARQMLLLAAATAQPTIAALAGATDEPEAATRALHEAVRAGLIKYADERIQFTHPLIASIPYADLAAAERRRLHQQLEISINDPEEHARHAALGSIDRSTAVAEALDSATGHARRRGSLDAAAELFHAKRAVDAQIRPRRPAMRPRLPLPQIPVQPRPRPAAATSPSAG
jgi:hypothetical protein